MLAPPERRARNRRYQRASRARRKAGLQRCTLWLSTLAIEGLLNQMVADKRLTDSQADKHELFEIALAALVEAQGQRWAR